MAVYLCKMAATMVGSMGGVKQDANVTQRHQTNMTSLVTLQALSN